MLSKEDVARIFNERTRKSYKKKGRFLARPCLDGETVLTIVAGRLETLKRGNAGEWVIRNIEIGGSAETYIIGGEKFDQRYEMVKEGEEGNPVRHVIDRVGWVEVTAKGRCEAVEWHATLPAQGDRITFMAPWGVEMECLEGDFLARPIPGADDDIYRIERETFFQTYGEET